MLARSTFSVQLSTVKCPLCIVKYLFSDCDCQLYRGHCIISARYCPMSAFILLLSAVCSLTSSLSIIISAVFFLLYIAIACLCHSNGILFSFLLSAAIYIFSIAFYSCYLSAVCCKLLFFAFTISCLPSAVSSQLSSVSLSNVCFQSCTVSGLWSAVFVEYISFRFYCHMSSVISLLLSVYSQLCTISCALSAVYY